MEAYEHAVYVCHHRRLERLRFGECLRLTIDTRGTSRGGGVKSSRRQSRRARGTEWGSVDADGCWYWALASAAYRNAQVTLEASLRDTSWTASLEQGSGYESRPGAVILDLDETVLDNSPLQAQLVLERTVYQTAIWEAWVGEMAAGLVPGSKEFVTFAEGRGIRTFYVTNRTAAEQDRHAQEPGGLGNTCIGRHRSLCGRERLDL